MHNYYNLGTLVFMQLQCALVVGKVMEFVLVKQHIKSCEQKSLLL